MTETMMNLRAVLEQTPDADLLREMIGFAAQRLMDLEVESLTGAAHGERSPDRRAQRNGYRDRDWDVGMEGSQRVAARSSCAFRNCARAATTSPAFWNPAVWPRRR